MRLAFSPKYSRLIRGLLVITTVCLAHASDNESQPVYCGYYRSTDMSEHLYLKLSAKDYIFPIIVTHLADDPAKEKELPSPEKFSRLDIKKRSVEMESVERSEIQPSFSFHLVGTPEIPSTYRYVTTRLIWTKGEQGRPDTVTLQFLGLGQSAQHF